MAEAPNTPNAADNQPVFTIEKIYLKDASVEVPNAPEIYLQREQPRPIRIEIAADPSAFSRAEKTLVRFKRARGASSAAPWSSTSAGSERRRPTV